MTQRNKKITREKVERTAQEHMPMGLSQLGLLERTRCGHGYVYKAQLKEYLEKDCAVQGDVGPVLTQLLS